uniref:Putative secreted protein n=1 Tax=Anopheles marajoara TaxID=58244 RepID=A0A2M4C774_9DIPT
MTGMVVLDRFVVLERFVAVDTECVVWFEVMRVEAATTEFTTNCGRFAHPWFVDALIEILGFALRFMNKRFNLCRQFTQIDRTGGRCSSYTTRHRAIVGRFRNRFIVRIVLLRPLCCRALVPA